MTRYFFVTVAFAAGLVGGASADLLVHWPLDEGSGGLVNDSTGNGHDGTFQGNPQWGEGLYGGALEFNGSSDYVIHTLP